MHNRLKFKRSITIGYCMRQKQKNSA